MEPWIKSASKEICKFWLEGDCLRPEGECAFAHSGQVVKLPEVCKFYRDNSKGKTCVKGKACRFLHETFPCVDFLLGRCEFQTNCKFSHDPFDEWMRKGVRKDFEEMESSLMVEIVQSTDAQEVGRLLAEWKHLRTVISREGLRADKAPNEDDDDDDLDDDALLKLARKCKSEATDGEVLEISSNECLATKALSVDRYVTGTFVNFHYARANMAKFQAYEEMERRIQKFYEEISVEKYDELSALLRIRD